MQSPINFFRPYLSYARDVKTKLMKFGKKLKIFLTGTHMTDKHMSIILFNILYI